VMPKGVEHTLAALADGPASPACRQP
jgi:hypothetical protein